ncbi:hypothetical protein CORC01_07479 [Colletotrichum orchidophilum]|uniref:NACHT domain-containing protein n=1 Tax=Colletotrichum orchidophilum TaxID=1209926 RepID=A0A1G4B7I0_9PEZI|nr:uncharacterized protein CORC01_07479 [Colletotrichum orchidophilum]OHE97225.1 hypothetical protein CORC01_07479 [Colletotrichum orchidophilum]
MAEAFGLAASVFATIQIADRVISICKNYIESVRDAPSDLRTILVETSSVGAVLQNVDFLLKFEEPDSALRKALDGDEGPVGECRVAIEQLEALLASDQNQAQGPHDSKRRRVQVTLRNLAWPLKETKAKKMLQDVARCKNTISLALTATSSHDIKVIREGTSHIQRVLTENQRSEVYKWLKHTDPSSIHDQACRNHEPGTCEWMSRTPEWDQFNQGDIRCLWIHGIPGAGKTILASQLAEKVEENCRQSSSTASISIGIHYYCYFGRSQDESAPFLRWILDRMCREVEQVPDYLWKLFKNGRDPSTSDLLTALEAASHYFSSISITIDAVDESSPREELLKVLRDLATDHRFSKIRLLVTSREYLDIEKVMSEISTEVNMRNDYLDADIRLYTESRLATNDKLKDWSEGLRKEALEALSVGAKGMFRWVVCQLDALRRIKGSQSAIMNELKHLPKTLNEAYDRIFEMIPEEDLQVVDSALDWICFNYKVFGREKFSCNVLLQAIEGDLNRQNSCTRDYRYDAELLLELCGCLIKVTETDHRFPYGYYEVSFPHYTVMEYLAVSTRFRPTSCFRLDKYACLGGRASIILLEVFRSPLNTIGMLESDEDCLSDPWDWQMDFRAYCAVSAIRLILDYERSCPENEELATMLTTPHPSRTHPVDAILRLYDMIVFWDFIDHYNLGDTFELVRFAASSPPESRILGYFLHMGAFYLVDFILHRLHDPRNLFRTMIDVKYDFLNDEAFSHFRTSLCDLIVIMSGDRPSALRHLLKTWPRILDYSNILVSYIMWHKHEARYVSCDGWCTLQEMLRLGAKLDSSEFVATPLQIAVAGLDLEGVRILLEGGAKPNARGNPGVVDRPKHGILRKCDHLSGMSPLQICRYGFQLAFLENVYRKMDVLEEVLDYRRQNFKKISGQIEALLCEYGGI